RAPERGIAAALQRHERAGDEGREQGWWGKAKSASWSVMKGCRNDCHPLRWRMEIRLSDASYSCHE
ncbi:hypothetical protein, partial [Burkholderia stabilis]